MTDLGSATICPTCSTPFHQPLIGRPRLYCKRTCRQLAYEERRALRKLTAAQGPVPTYVSDDSEPGA